MKRRAFLTLFAALPAVIQLPGCGFQLRGAHAIPYRSLYLDAPTDSRVGKQLANALRSQGIVITETAKSADAVLKLSQVIQNRSILALSGGGRVREYRLNYSLSYSLTGKDGKEIYPDSTIQSTRDFTYDDNQYLAKAAEENFLYRDLQDDVVQQILRRLATPR
jgi:LPS-assembly lipoprotein